MLGLLLEHRKLIAEKEYLGLEAHLRRPRTRRTSRSRRTRL